ncbi:cation:proton antiporter family protein [Alisedimentitalea sp. MJ-SS2]|uniref:cation:proton antiporter family protein n=1 Tax=Aliisedimentitalea sp. MJ-SS2 TaxID=3049795 RepID=UPI0029067F5C|nr:cation:proton antiporter family protein [Alisedimentitalea sp. MJ-SS2]MDU8927649.1 cation:proton antiporter family protein [Alisedimentitalea sp. MJ-SS2]
MEFEWIAIALGDVAWITLAFILGLLASQVGLPPLVGFLVTGFVLGYLGTTGGDVLNKLADLGITILLFTVGLKLDLRALIRPQVWAVTLLHSTITTVVAGLLVFWLAVLGLPFFAGLDLGPALVIGFALSFSSTVFAVSSLETSGEMKSLHGSIAIGILIMQDLAAVAFLAASTGKLPAIWSPALFALVFLRPLLIRLLLRVGHGELMILYGLVLALGGAELFELAGIKGDLGALVLGVLVAGHRRSDELAKSMFGFKDLFLVGFFLSIGLVGELTWQALLVGLALVPLVLGKSALFLALMTRFHLRARTSLLASLNLSNFSEFGLIVTAIGVANGWLGPEWLVVLAVALSVSFIIAAPLVAADDWLYGRYRPVWTRLQREPRLPDDDYLDTQAATIAVFGMGRVGTGAYDTMREHFGETVIGVDFNHNGVCRHRDAGRNVLHGDPSDADFWEKVDADHRIELVMLALPTLIANLDALAQLRRVGFQGKVTATARHPGEEKKLAECGATAVFNIYKEAGAGFAEHTMAMAES